ncbi:PIG-L deacetylase family protein [Streptomyces sp. NPDC057620]|uniref:PIG-L deacetylase family protein n=1 Tax=Streptomyces sp. NPDC057620 TaxID=3346185 RepID=UPI0036CC4856
MTVDGQFLVRDGHAGRFAETLGSQMADLLVLAPHMDDETLGCGGVLALAEDPLVVFAVAPRDEGTEINAVAKLLGFRYIVLHGAEWEARLLSLDRRELVRRLEETLHAERPARVLIPAPSHHQDHVVVFEAGVSATRPMSRHGYVARMVATYEYPGSVWGRDGHEHELNYFVDISQVCSRKIEAVKQYQGSQSGRPVAEQEVVTAWARLRGSTIGVSYAEAFRILRLVDEGGPP